jgi:hypothetical protein
MVVAIPKAALVKLPKAHFFRITWGGYYREPYFAKFRGANFIRWQLWWVRVQHRAPWLEHSARQLHPHLFDRQS